MRTEPTTAGFEDGIQKAHTGGCVWLLSTGKAKRNELPSGASRKELGSTAHLLAGKGHAGLYSTGHD